MTSAALPRRVRPRIAFAIGCPAGIAPELTARMLADREITDGAQIVIFGDRRVLEMGQRVSGTSSKIRVVQNATSVPDADEPILVDLGHLDPASIRIGEVSLAAGQFAEANFQHAIAFAAAGHADAVTFSPFNKSAMRLAFPRYDDEVVYLAERFGFRNAASEFNVLPNLWNARVTSHVPLSQVAALITPEAVMKSLRLADQAMRDAGFKNPRIAVAGINPHAGDGGNCGREEIDVLEPTVRAARASGIECTGPLPADTVFVRANKGEFDAVLTMYHDQGQIAMKLLGFDRGVTLLGGYAFPILTAAHGSAYDIAGKGVANPGAMRHAMQLAIRMGKARVEKSA